jgi:hypothetical protein
MKMTMKVELPVTYSTRIRTMRKLAGIVVTRKEGSQARWAEQRSYIYNIELREQVVGGSIAQRFLPAAEYLARFVAEAFQPGVLHSLSMSRDGSEEFESLQNLLLSSSSSPLRLLGLGAGLGLTGMAIATQIVERQGKSAGYLPPFWKRNYQC